MPYIKIADRVKYDIAIDTLISRLEGAPDGNVNYVISRLIDGHFGQDGYTTMAHGIGCLEAVKLEFYRRRVAPYEDKKRDENGEVYT